jgi:hypothetical protein
MAKKSSYVSFGPGQMDVFWQELLGAYKSVDTSFVVGAGDASGKGKRRSDDSGDDER